MDGYHWYHICFYISDRIRIRIRIMSIMSDKIWLMSTSQIYDLGIRTRIRYWMLNIRIRIRTDLNPSKRIRSWIRSKNNCTFFIPPNSTMINPTACEHACMHIGSALGFFINAGIGNGRSGAAPEPTTSGLDSFFFLEPKPFVRICLVRGGGVCNND